MAWAPLLLTLLTYCSGASSQPTLTQPPSDSVSLGNTMKLSCTLSSQHSGYIVGWYQQRDGQAPRFLWLSSGTKGDGVPDRFTISSSGAIRYLTITNVQPEDEATYYCGADYSSGSSYGLWFKSNAAKHQGTGVPSGFSGSKDVANTTINPTITDDQADDETGYYCGTGSGVLHRVSLQPVVTQELSMSVTPGGTVTLSCSLSNGAITTSNAPGWFQQKPGSAPQLLIYNTNNRPTGIPARFSGSISGNNAVLTITGVQAEDEADYYCVVYTSPWC
ncbi:uncharacterized protein ACDP82_016592 [Pangshura tecta]